MSSAKFSTSKNNALHGKEGQSGALGGNYPLWRIPEWFPHLAPDILLQLKTYHGQLLKFNSHVNLISRHTEREADDIHFADCLYAADVLEKNGLGKRVFDIGSGNGLPGILLAILKPQSEFSLVESDTRKCEFQKHVIHVLGLKNVSVVNARLESLGSVGMEECVSRGFATIAKTLLACNKLYKGQGRFFHLKGANWSTEVGELPAQLIAAWKPSLIGEYSLPGSQAKRALIVTTKLK